MRWSSIHRWLPEILLGIVALFFTFRELGSFPATWEDSGLYTMVAQSLSAGYGYSLPILHQRWLYPYFLSVGPTVIVPVAFFIKLLGFSLATARIAPALYLLGTCVAFYAYVRRIAAIWDARWATALLITLSAFVNNGKPVLGTVPAFFFLLLALHALRSVGNTWRGAVVKGVFFGLSILSKITFTLIIPALVLAAVYKGAIRQCRTMGLLLITLCTATALFLPWLLLEVSTQSGFSAFLVIVFSRPPGDFVAHIADMAVLLLRFQYQYFLILLALGVIGFAGGNFRLSSRERVFLVALFLLFFAHFLVREGWYRHLLPAHLLLLPFVPAGARRLFARHWTFLLLGFFVILQAVWQLDHRGSPQSTAAVEAAAYIQENLTDEDLLIEHPEIFVRLPDNPHWMYFPLPGNRELMPEEFVTRSPDEFCMLRVRKPSEADREKYGSRLITIGGKYALIPQRPECTQQKK